MEQSFLAVLAGGFLVFGLFLLMSAGGDIGLPGFGQQTPDEMVFMDKGFGTVGATKSDFRTIGLGDFTVGEARGMVTGYTNNRAEISDSLFSSNKLWFQYNATQPRDASLSFEVLGREGRGQVFVKVNGEQVYKEYLIATGSPEITIQEGLLNPGMNKIQVGVYRQNFIGSSKYALEEIEFKANDRKFHDYDTSFTLYPYEIQDFTGAKMSFSITESIKTSPLTISVNDNTVYSKPQVRTSGETVEITPTNADLRPGLNEVTFSTDRPSKYVIDNAQVTTKYLGSVRSGDASTTFGLNQSQISYADRNDTREYVSFNYRALMPSTRPLMVRMNGFEETINPSNGFNRLEIPSTQFERNNRLAFFSNGTYNMERVRVYSIMAEEG